MAEVRPRVRIGLALGALLVGLGLPLVAGSPAAATTLQTTVQPPIDGRVTSSPDEPHHTPYDGDYSFDVAGTATAVARFRNTTGGLSLSVASVGPACRSGVFADGGNRITLNVFINGSKVGTVAYAHLTGIPFGPGAGVPVGAALGRPVTTADGVRSNSCWTGPHVHVEPRNDVRYGCYFAGQLNSNVNGGNALGIVGGERAGAKNVPCGPGSEGPGGNNPRGSYDELVTPEAGLIRVRGWALDDDDRTAPLEIHAYVGGPAGDPAAAGHNLGLANAFRPDVGAAFPGVGDYHGIDVTFNPGRLGNLPVYVYAINRGGTGGDNVLLGAKSVTVANPEPQGAYESAGSPAPGQVRVSGWAFDRSNAPGPIRVHAYVGGPAGTANLAGIDLGPAQVARPDVGAAFPGVGSNHGFDVTFPTSRTGSQPVYLYAINSGAAGSNVLLGFRTVTIAPPASLPSNVSRPLISGKTRVGKVLAATSGQWTGGPLSFTYQWARNGAAIPGATSSSYRLRKKDLHKRITVHVTVNAVVTATSEPTRRIRPRQR